MIKSICSSIILLMGYFIHQTIGEKFIVKLTVSENKGSGENILNLKAYIMQNKLPINPNGSYEMISNEPDITNYFILQSKTGQLKQRNNIDRETLCKHADVCQKILLISVNGQVIEVVIDIEDENDNIPQFSMRHKTLSIQENSDIGLELSLPTADDSDSEKNSISRYFIKDSRSRDIRKSSQFLATKYFTIIEKIMNKIKIPYLKSIKEIDREEIDRFELILVAEDSGKQQGSCTITVSVVDVNDNSPQWPSISIYKKVRECDRQGPLLELQAFDRDDSSTLNGQIKYKISDHSPKIEIINRLVYIAGTSLFLSNQGLQLIDFKGQINFFITAADGGGRENDTTVTIEIEDCNDHPPNIQVTKSTVAVKENDNSLITLTTVTVRDDDKGINSEFNCDLNDTTYFLLSKEHTYNQPNGGQLILYNIKKLSDTAFDREAISFYSVLIRCVDQGRPSLTGEKMFSVTILDENDNSPKFPSNEIKFSITENNIIGSTIGYVRANDPDSNDNGRVTYQILSNEENYYFTITSFGKIETKWKFDREVKDSYSLMIMAKDNGELSLNDTCTVFITILDVNDCVPIFKQQYFYQITESNSQTMIHAILGKVVAEDIDLGENGTVYYRIRPKPTNSRQNNIGLSLLKINLEGVLNIYGVVDREVVSSIQAEIVAYDNGKPQLSAVTTVIVDVLDVNDNKPKFKHPMGNINYVNISTDSPVGKLLANVEAEDPDKGENGTINYSIMSHKKVEQNLPYQLQQDGRLILVQSLKDRDDIPRLPDRLIIRAADNGVPPKSQLQTIHIKYISNSPTPRNHIWPPGSNKKVNDKSRPGGFNHDNYRDNDGSDNMTMLYVLAGVLFVVFIIVLLVLVYTYFSGRLSRNRQMELTREKDLNNYCNDGTGNYESDLLTANTATCQDNFNKMTLGSISSPTTDKNNYTHLMRMNEAKYTPIHLNSNYIQSLCNDGFIPVQSSILQSNSDSRNYEQCLQNRSEPGDKQTFPGPGNKWNSIENISISNNGMKSALKSNDNNFFYNAHSYAAYINQFGIDTKDPISTTMDDSITASKSKIKQQTLPSNPKKPSKDESQMFTYQPIAANSSTKNQSKKCYVSSSFV